MTTNTDALRELAKWAESFAYRHANDEEDKLNATSTALRQAADTIDAQRKLLEKARDALAEELAAWDIEPPLAHVKNAHDAITEHLKAQP